MENNKRNKGMLISIIIFFSLFAILSSTGIFLRATKGLPEDNIKENINHKFKFNNNLYFYDENNNLIGKHECRDSSCDYATSIIDDDKHPHDYYQTKDLKTSLINNRYAFIFDNKKILLYDFKEKIILSSYQSIKNYGIGINNDIFITKDEEGKFGAISLKNNFKIIIDFKYDFIGLINTIDTLTNKLVNDTFIASQDNKYYIIDSNNAKLSQGIENAIVSYSGLMIKTVSENQYQLYDYEGINLLNNNYKILNLKGKFVEAVSENNYLTIYSFDNKKALYSPILLLKNDFSNSVLFPPYKIDYNDSVIVVTLYTDQEYGTYRTININI